MICFKSCSSSKLHINCDYIFFCCIVSFLISFEIGQFYTFAKCSFHLICIHCEGQANGAPVTSLDSALNENILLASRSIGSNTNSFIKSDAVLNDSNSKVKGICVQVFI